VGAGELSSAVADAGPLIHLYEIGSLALLDIFSTLHIPDAVWRETVGVGRVPEGDLLSLGTVQRHALLQPDVAQFVQDHGLEALHSGECECLCLCRQTAVAVLVTDDLAAREASRSIGITPVGSLGIVARAYGLGRLSLTDAERCLWDLYNVSTLFVTPAIVEAAIQQLRAHPGGP
jgi:predicted nucleic acid-binding protein